MYLPLIVVIDSEPPEPDCFVDVDWMLILVNRKAIDSGVAELSQPCRVQGWWCPTVTTGVPIHTAYLLKMLSVTVNDTGAAVFTEAR